MTASWRCGCGHEGTGEAAAQRHAKVCGRMGYPRGWPAGVVVRVEAKRVES